MCRMILQIGKQVYSSTYEEYIASTNDYEGMHIKLDVHELNKEKRIKHQDGVNDPRCPVEESRQFRDALVEMGWEEAEEGDKTFEYVEFSEEGHGAMSDISTRIRTFKLMLDFFDRRLK